MKSTFICFTIWVLTALLNAVLSSVAVCFTYGYGQNWFAPMPMIFIATLIFSTPGMLIFWIVMLFNVDEDILFRILLKAGFIISVVCSLLLAKAIGSGDREITIISVCVVIAFISSIMIHHSKIKAINKHKTTLHHV